MARTFNYELAAAALVDAAYMGEKEAAKKHGVTRRTIYNYRARLETDPKLSVFFLEKKKLADREWANELPDAIRSAIVYLRESAQQIDRRDPDAVVVVTGALRALAEVAMTREILDARIAGQNRPPSQEG